MDVAPGQGTVADRIAARLARYLGPHTGRVAVKTFAIRGLHRSPETLAIEDVPAMTQALRPMLRAMLGRQRCEFVIQTILSEFQL
jgi:hypothetical protein